jgi:hypothetical protein
VEYNGGDEDMKVKEGLGYGRGEEGRGYKKG